MNFTNIFFLNGQYNWDAISTISNVILVAALILVTFWYSSKIKKQTELLVIDQERPKILEEVQVILTPLINHLGSEINAIQQNDFFGTGQVLKYVI